MFDSPEDMFAYMDEAERSANASTHPAQASIGFGEYVIRPMEQFLIFGRIYERDERNSGEDPETIKRLDDAYSRGYRTGFWSSDALPEGEPGDAHVVSLWRIFKEEYEAAKAVDWETEAIVRSDWGRAMFARILEEQNQSNATGLIQEDES